MDVCQWHLKHGEDLLRFMKESDGNDKHELLMKLMSTKWDEKKAWMLFSIDHTEEVRKVLTLSQVTKEPVGICPLPS